MDVASDCNSYLSGTYFLLLLLLFSYVFSIFLFQPLQHQHNQQCETYLKKILVGPERKSFIITAAENYFLLSMMELYWFSLYKVVYSQYVTHWPSLY